MLWRQSREADLKVLALKTPYGDVATRRGVPAAAGRGGRTLPSSFWREHSPTDTSISCQGHWFGTSGLQHCTKINYCFKGTQCDRWSGQSQETNTDVETIDTFPAFEASSSPRRTDSQGAGHVQDGACWWGQGATEQKPGCCGGGGVHLVPCGQRSVRESRQHPGSGRGP